MTLFTPIAKEFFRRFSILILLALFSWLYFYSPSDIYELQVKDYVKSYQNKVKNGSINSSKTSLNDYIAKEMKGSYTWSTKEKNIVEVEGEHSKFLNHLSNVNQGDSTDAYINEHRSSDIFWSGNSYFFRSGELPKDFLSQTYLKHPDYLVSRSKTGQKNYFRLYKVQRVSMLNAAPIFIAHPLRNYSYILLLISLVIYFLLPKVKVPNGAAYYTRLNAVSLPDLLSFFLWSAAWMFFFLPDDSAPAVVRYIFLLFFIIFALALILPTVKYASRWYLFTEDSFQWSGKNGIESISLADIISIKPYTRSLPKWIAPLIILLGRAQPGPTGIGTLTATSSPEIGMEIIANSGKKIKVMANYLESSDEFTERFQALEKRVGKKS